MQMTQECPQCAEDARCRRRDFSEQTWSVLLAWGEVAKDAVDQPICDTCYNDLRELLIDRADEVSNALVNPPRSAPAAAPAAKKAATATAKKATATAPAAAAAPKAKKPAGKSKKTSKVA